MLKTGHEDLHPLPTIDEIIVPETITVPELATLLGQGCSAPLEGATSESG